MLGSFIPCLAKPRFFGIGQCFIFCSVPANTKSKLKSTKTLHGASIMKTPFLPPRCYMGQIISTFGPYSIWGINCHRKHRAFFSKKNHLLYQRGTSQTFINRDIGARLLFGDITCSGKPLSLFFVSF